MVYTMKKLLAILLTLSLMGGALPVLAAEEPQPQPIPVWAYSQIADGYAMGLFGDEIALTHSQPVTQEQLDGLTQAVAHKLALLEVDARQADGEPLVLDTTRGGVVNALYQEAAAYAFPGVEAGAVDFMTSLGALCGDGTGLHLERPCTVLEAAAMARSLILSLYDGRNAGSLGLLWKATGGGNTLYLLGSIHMDRDNVYPFHKQLRDIITDAELVTFELDLNDQQQIAEFSAMQMYADGTTLADHVAPELYQTAVEALASLGMPEEAAAQFKPWALANTFQTLALADESTGSTIMPVDMYVNAKAVNAGVPIGAVETYAFQGGIFDGLSDEYQEAYLASALALFLGGSEDMDPEIKAAMDAELALAGTWMEQWKSRDVAGFAASYPKDEMLKGEDELNSKLFTERDPGMIAYAASYLKQEGSHTGLMVVGAGHMIGATGIVQGLIDLGYTVEAVPVP